jgi:hypothetical protein
MFGREKYSVQRAAPCTPRARASFQRANNVTKPEEASFQEATLRNKEPRWCNTHTTHVHTHYITKENHTMHTTTPPITLQAARAKVLPRSESKVEVQAFKKQWRIKDSKKLSLQTGHKRTGHRKVGVGVGAHNIIFHAFTVPALSAEKKKGPPGTGTKDVMMTFSWAPGPRTTETSPSSGVVQFRISMVPF